MTAAGQRAALRLLILALGAGLGTGFGIACSQAPAPETAAEAPQDAAAPDAAPAAAPEPLADETAATAAETDPAEEAAEPDATVIVIERGDRDRDREREAKPRTLYEAAVAAREERAKAGPSRVSITDDNLHEFQGKGLTFAEEPEGEEAGAEADGDGEGASSDATDRPAAEAERGESYWRSRVRDLRLALRQAVDELTELEERAASLRRSFYAADDPYVRDAEIKPAWDRALDRLAHTRRAIFRLWDEIEATLEAGRQAGALPGWLREGIELEPQPEELPEPREGIHEPGEPSVIEIGEPPL